MAEETLALSGTYEECMNLSLTVVVGLWACNNMAEGLPSGVQGTAGLDGQRNLHIRCLLRRSSSAGRFYRRGQKSHLKTREPRCGLRGIAEPVLALQVPRSPYSTVSGAAWFSILPVPS